MPATANRLAAVLCFIGGAFPIGIATGLIRTRPESIHAPLYIVALAGLLFWIAAASLLFGSKSHSACRLTTLGFRNLLESDWCAALAIPVAKRIEQVVPHER